MVKLSEMPSEAIISGYRGIVDFYAWNGIPVARKWPRKPDPRGIPEVEATWPAWSYAMKLWKTLSPVVQSAYLEMAIRGGLNGRDLQVRGFLKGIFTYPH